MRVGSVAGNLDVPAGSILVPEGPEGISVAGQANFEGDAKVEGSLRCRSLSLDRGNLRVAGALQVAEGLEARHGGVRVDGDLTAREVEVSRSCVVLGTFRSDRAEIGGHLEVNGPTLIQHLEAGGSIDLRGPLTAEDVEVGGRILLAGGTAKGSVSVGGLLEVRGDFAFGTLEAGGKIALRGRCSGESIDVGGSLDVEGDLTLTRSVEVGGFTSVQGHLKAPRLEVGGVFRGTSLECEDIEIGGVLETTGAIRTNRLEIGGKLRAERVEARERAELSGRVTTRLGLKAGRLEVGEDSRIQGPLVGEEVTLEDDAEAEDIWGGSVRLERKARAGNIYARDVEIARKVRIDGQVSYTGELRVDPDARLAHPPQKVSVLPTPPL